MRLDARLGDRGWFVFDVPRCREVPYVVWVDDVTCELAEYVEHRGPEPVIRRVKRILIVPASRLVLINPVDDENSERESAKDKRVDHA